MDDFRVETLDELPCDIDAKVQQGHEYEESTHGVVCDYRRFAMLVRDNAQYPIGVLSAYTAYAEIYVDDIWVDSCHRRCGIGRSLLTALERAFRHRGYNNINLVTSAFQAVGFYEKCGFQREFTRVNRYHPKLTKTFFIKYFDESAQTRGTLPGGTD